MGTPTGTALLTSGGIPIPLLWDPVSSAWVPYAGINTFAIGGSTGNTSGYNFGCQALSGAGWFKGAAGSYKGATSIWIMIFDATAAPSTNTVPVYAAAVAAISGTADNNWFIAPSAPRYVSTGLWIAISTTGGLFTASANKDITGTVEFYASGT